MFISTVYVTFWGFPSQQCIVLNKRFHVIIIMFLYRLDQGGNTLLINVQEGVTSHYCYCIQTPTPTRSALILLQRKELWPLVLGLPPKVSIGGHNSGIFLSLVYIVIKKEFYGPFRLVCYVLLVSNGQTWDMNLLF